MTDSVATFFDAWSMTDADARRRAIDSAMAPAFTYSDPRSGGRLTDPGALNDYLGAFSANAPGWTATVASADTRDGYVRALVAFGGKGPDGTDMVQHGQYFAELDGDGRIATIVGFVGTGAPE